MEVNHFHRITHFSFWTPVNVIRNENLSTGFLANLGWRLGQWADHYAYLGHRSLQVTAERLLTNQIYFEGEEQGAPSSKWSTALKVASYVISFGLLITVALTIKAIFKSYLNHSKTLTERSPNEIFAHKLVGKTHIVLLTGDLFAETTDVIVNAANKRLGFGGGVCGFFEKWAGKGIFTECADILKSQEKTVLNCGEAALTSGGDLAPRIKAIVHTIGPDCRPDMAPPEEIENRETLLSDAYTSSLELIAHPENHAGYINSTLQPEPLRSISFPAISTGIFGYKSREAFPSAYRAIQNFIRTNPDALDEVRLIFFNEAQETLNFYQRTLQEL